MAVVRTINGDVSPDTLGVVNAHDHLIRVGAGEVYIDPDHLLDDVDKAAQEATYFVEASKSWAAGGTIIDMCPASSGRGVLKTLQVVEKVPGLQVVQATGFHQQKVYLEWRQSWVNQYTVTQIADLLIADIVEGIDRFDYMGPIVERTNVKAGVIKWATAYGKITEWEKKSGQAVAIASKETGCPINTHVTAGTCGPEQARFLVDQGVDPAKIAIGHMQRNWDPWVHEQICKLGCYVELDGTNRIKYVPDNTRVNLVKTLGEKGYGKQILLGTDSGKASYQKVYGSVSGIDYDPAVFCPRLVEDEGVDRDYVNDPPHQQRGHLLRLRAAGRVTTMPRLQIALDTYDLPSALAPLATAVDQIDIIECGTILVLAEGMDAVRAIRAAYPDKTILC